MTNMIKNLIKESLGAKTSEEWLEISQQPSLTCDIFEKTELSSKSLNTIISYSTIPKFSKSSLCLSCRQKEKEITYNILEIKIYKENLLLLAPRINEKNYAPLKKLALEIREKAEAAKKDFYQLFNELNDKENYLPLKVTNQEMTLFLIKKKTIAINLEKELKNLYNKKEDIFLHSNFFNLKDATFSIKEVKIISLNLCCKELEDEILDCKNTLKSAHLELLEIKKEASLIIDNILSLFTWLNELKEALEKIDEGFLQQKKIIIIK